jgi:hypothetical protein
MRLVGTRVLIRMAISADSVGGAITCSKFASGSDQEERTAERASATSTNPPIDAVAPAG